MTIENRRVLNSLVDSDLIEGFYDDLESMKMELDPDPLESGPKRLNEKIAVCRSLLSRCGQIFLRISKDLHGYKRSWREATAIHGLKIQELLANDPEVRAGRNVTDREAVANTKLRKDREAIDQLHFAVEDLTAVLVVVRAKRDDLKDTQGRLRDQLKVCQEELSLGARWGSRPRSKSVQESTEGARGASSRDDVESFMDEVIAKQQTTLTLDETVESVPEGTGAPEISVGLPAFIPEGGFREDITVMGTMRAADVDAMLEEIPKGMIVGNDVGISKKMLGEDLDSFLDAFGSD